MSSNPALDAAIAKVTEAGAKVKALKDAKASKDEIDAAVAVLQAAKAEQEVIAPGSTNQGRAAKPKKDDKPKEAEKPAQANVEGTQLGMNTTKAEDFFNWYPQAIVKSEMIE
jgi:hypothetical protein